MPFSIALPRGENSAGLYLGHMVFVGGGLFLMSEVPLSISLFGAYPPPPRQPVARQFIDYKTSMITDEDPLRGVVVLLGSRFLSHTTRS